MEPRVLTMAEIARRVVVFPAPLAPSTGVITPSSLAKLTPCGAWVRPETARTVWTSRMAPTLLSQIRLDDFGVALHLGGAPLGDALAEVEHHDLLRHLHDQAHVVLDEENRDGE